MDFRGSVGIQNPFFLGGGGVPAFLQRKKQGKEGEGRFLLKPAAFPEEEVKGD